MFSRSGTAACLIYGGWGFAMLSSSRLMVVLSWEGSPSLARVARVLCGTGGGLLVVGLPRCSANNETWCQSRWMWEVIILLYCESGPRGSQCVVALAVCAVRTTLMILLLVPPPPLLPGGTGHLSQCGINLFWLLPSLPIPFSLSILPSSLHPSSSAVNSLAVVSYQDGDGETTLVSTAIAFGLNWTQQGFDAQWCSTWWAVARAELPHSRFNEPQLGLSDDALKTFWRDDRTKQCLFLLHRILWLECFYCHVIHYYYNNKYTTLARCTGIHIFVHWAS